MTPPRRVRVQQRLVVCIDDSGYEKLIIFDPASGIHAVGWDESNDEKGTLRNEQMEKGIPRRRFTLSRCPFWLAVGRWLQICDCAYHADGGIWG
jgi:hypothetical protein